MICKYNINYKDIFIFYLKRNYIIFYQTLQDTKVEIYVNREMLIYLIESYIHILID